MNKEPLYHSLLASALACTLLVGCGGKGEGAPASAASAPAGAASAPAGQARGGGAVAVTTTVARQRDLELTLDAIGSVSPLSSVDVKPQVNSVVTQVHVREGQFVRTGELLFTLDARADQANLAKMRAQLAKDEAALADAQRQLARSRDLLAKNFVSQGALDTSQAQVDGQQAVVASDRAAIDAAQVALSYDMVKAPGSGRLGTIAIYPGTSVQANQTTLVTITQLDPINVSFAVPQAHLATILAGLQSGGARVNARLPNDKTVLQGKLLFVDNLVDAATGTVKVKARFDNKESKLWPGAFVNVSMVARTLKGAVVIPTAAVIQSGRGSVVYVAAQGKAQLRPVQVVGSQGDEVAVTGVAAGDHVVLEGRQNLRPDAALVERAPEARAPASGSSAPARPASGAAP